MPVTSMPLVAGDPQTPDVNAVHPARERRARRQSPSLTARGFFSEGRPAMSYDFCIREREAPADKCACGRAHPRFYVDLGNPTYNVGNIFREATDGMFAQGKEIPLDDARAMWAKALARLESEPDAFRHLQPSNGWGSVESATENARDAVRAIDAVLSGERPTVRKWEPLEYEEGEPEMRIVDVTMLVFVA